MIKINVSRIKELRQCTQLGMSDCKNALVEANDDMDKAIEILRKKGLKKVNKVADRATDEGKVVSYVHNNKIGVLVEINCETDFATSNREFETFCNDISIQIASMNPFDRQDLMKQNFVKDNSKTISNMQEELIAKLGENIQIKRFTRYELGKQ